MATEPSTAATVPSPGTTAPPAAATGDPASAVAPVEGAVSPETPADMAAFVAEMDALPANHGEPVEAGTVSPVETTQPAETTKQPVASTTPVDPVAAEPAEPEPVRAARAILASANRKARQAAEMVPAAEAKLIEQFRTDPAAFFARAGITEQTDVQAWFKKFAGQEAAPATNEPPEPKWAKDLREANEARKRSDEDATVARLTQNVIKTVTDAADKFPLIAQEKAAEKVPAKMIAYHSQHGKPCSIEWAAKLVERDLRAAGKKVPAAPAATAPATTPASTRSGSVTMNNSETRGAPPGNDLSDDPDVRLRQVQRELEAMTA